MQGLQAKSTGRGGSALTVRFHARTLPDFMSWRHSDGGRDRHTKKYLEQVSETASRKPRWSGAV